MHTLSLFVGMLVAIVLPSGHHRAGEIRPAIVTRVNGDPNSDDTTVNVQVFQDGLNDVDMTAPGSPAAVIWLGSLGYNVDRTSPGTFHHLTSDSAILSATCIDMTPTREELIRDFVAAILAQGSHHGSPQAAVALASAHADAVLAAIKPAPTV